MHEHYYKVRFNMNYIFIKNIADILGSKPKNMCAGIRHNENIEICKSLDCSNWPCHKFDKLTSQG